jgi:hypothetical protein
MEEDLRILELYDNLSQPMKSHLVLEEVELTSHVDEMYLCPNHRHPGHPVDPLSVYHPLVLPVDQVAALPILLPHCHRLRLPIKVTLEAFILTVSKTYKLQPSQVLPTIDLSRRSRPVDLVALLDT